jgi:hypothetical protein
MGNHFLTPPQINQLSSYEPEPVTQSCFEDASNGREDIFAVRGNLFLAQEQIETDCAKSKYHFL